MKIVEIIPQLSSGGAERFVVDLCNEFVCLGHEVVLVTLYSLENNYLSFYREELDSKVKVISLNKKSGIDFKLYVTLNTILKSLCPDIVHSHLRALPYLSIPIIFNRKVKYFHTIHNDAKVEASDIINRLTRKFLFRYKLCTPITISKESDTSFSIFYGSGTQRKLIINGSPLRRSDPKQALELREAKLQGKKTLVNVARVMPQKNQRALINAVKRIPDVDLFIVGNDTGEYADSLKLIDAPNVHFLGQRKNPRDYMSAADAFILPSAYEGMPITLIECFSVGAIPLVTPVGGISNMVDDLNNGLVATDTSEDAIYEMITRFVALTNEQVSVLSLNSARSFSKYSIDECANHYIDLFTNR